LYLSSNGLPIFLPRANPTWLPIAAAKKITIATLRMLTSLPVEATRPALKRTELPGKKNAGKKAV